MRKPQELTAILAQIESEMVEYLRKACKGRVEIPTYVGSYLVNAGLVQEIIRMGDAFDNYRLFNLDRTYTATDTGRRVYWTYASQVQRREKDKKKTSS